MQETLKHFCTNLDRARGLEQLAESFSNLTTEVLDLSDILRASLVHAVSALDHFVHEFVRLGMLDVYHGKRLETKAYLAFNVPLSATRKAIEDINQDLWLDYAIREAHSWRSFQHPDKIAGVVSLMSTVKLWDKVAEDMGTTSKEVKTRLRTIVDRRNKIAHEADMDPTNPGYRWPIDRTMVKEAINFIDNIVQSIFRVA